MSETKPPAQAIVPTPSQAVALRDRGIVLSNLDELLKFAKMCANNGVAPKGMNEQQAAIAIQTGLERGLGIMGGLQAAVIINGVVSWRGWAVVGLIQNSPVCVPGTFRSWVEGEGEARTGKCVAVRRGYTQPFMRSFSMLEAKRAGLLTKDGPWKTDPDNMLEWRAIGEMGKFHFGDVLGGMPIAEDITAGGYGPVETEPVKELPPTPEPGPKVTVIDPVLAELAPGAPMVPTEVLRAKAVEQAGEFVKTPEVQKVIDVQVDEALPFPAPGLSSMTCQRCHAQLNSMGGCDVCGWPGPDNGERP